MLSLLLSTIVAVQIDTIKEAVVTAEQISRSSSVQVLSGPTLENLSTSSVSDALKFFSGVQIKDYGGLGGQKTVNVRSLGSQHVGVYLDGVRITNVQNGTVDLGKFSLDNIESVELYNANKTALLMSASEFASASTVYITTKKPSGTGGSIQYSYGSYQSHNAKCHFSFKKYFTLSAEYANTKGNYPFEYHSEYEDTVGIRQNSDIVFGRAEVAAFYKNFTAHVYYYQSERGIPGGVVRRLSNKYTNVGREWDRNVFGQLSYTNTWGLHSVKFISKYTNDFLHYRSDYPENISVHLNNKYIQQDVYNSGTYALDFKWIKVSASTDIRWSDLRCDVKYFDYVSRLDIKSGLSMLVQYGGLSVFSNCLFTAVKDSTPNRAKTLFKPTGNVTLNFKYGPLSFRAFYKQVFRVPTLNDLYYTQVGNRNLKPELTNQIDLGLTFSNSWCNLQTDFYYNLVKDRIVCMPLKGSYQWSMMNYGKTRCFGIDVSARFKYKNHSWFITATYQDDRNRTDPMQKCYNDFVCYSPQFSASAIYTLSWKNFDIAISHMYVGKRYWLYENDLDEPLSPYNCTDVKLSYSYNDFVISAECQNLFNNHYEIVQRWPMPGRLIKVTLKIKY